MVLSARGIVPAETAAFLKPISGKLHPPELLPDAEKASARLKLAIDAKERILIYSDYDVDGIVGGLVAYGGLKELGANCSLFLPERTIHGYGLCRDVLERAVSGGVTLVLSVDCGISNIEEAAFLRESGTDLIISDHHEPSETLPTAYAVVDPKIQDCGYPYRDLSGAMVAAKLISRVYEQCGRSGEEFLQRNLALLAMATVVDVCPIDGENRTIVAQGLAKFADDAPPGLLEMCRRAKVIPGEIDVFGFGFVLGPRLNAAGRLESPRLAAELISASDNRKIGELVSKLEYLNRQRKSHTSRGIAEASGIIDSGERQGEILALWHPGWHEGVLGLIASGLVDKYKRPALIATDMEGGFCKGSGRTSGNFNLLNALREADGKLSSYGGHKGAVGFKLRIDDFPEFVNDLASADACKVDEEMFHPELTTDGEISFGDIGDAEVEELMKTRPWGRGNEEPVFLIRDLEIKGYDTMGDGTHVRLALKGNGNTIDAIGFGLNRDGIFAKELTSSADVVAIPEINDFRGRRNVRLRLKDISFHEP
jgi:single-stranded-DNA-specific exonuclease